MQNIVAGALSVLILVGVIIQVRTGYALKPKPRRVGELVRIKNKPDEFWTSLAFQVLVAIAFGTAAFFGK